VEAYVEEHEIGVLIFDDELSPAQTTEYRKTVKVVKFLIVPTLILDIFFHKRAQNKVTLEHKLN